MHRKPCQRIPGIGGGTSIFQNGISLFDSTCLRDSIPKRDSCTSPASYGAWMLLSRNVQHDNMQEIPVNCIHDGWRRCVHVYVRVCCHSASPPSGPVHRLSLMRGLDHMRRWGTLGTGIYRPLLPLAFIWKTLQREGRAGKPGAQRGPLMSHA